jgi:hypothetical protein
MQHLASVGFPVRVQGEWIHTSHMATLTPEGLASHLKCDAQKKVRNRREKKQGRGFIELEVRSSCSSRVSSASGCLRRINKVTCSAATSASVSIVQLSSCLVTLK